ncbi:transmembrane 220 family protein [Catalinimonas niigatensis]|uniref:transmembrane 220 family protein n=1 Tax=Catalinimonas niigatensis TaxID=1397264 RepID=UPI002666642A|nr:transmembrane 220 family protein [Catalinimonas niigatensis]WPP48089.1 transmembrane 220 family protein [Catalinimonas niigatensis]
MKIVNITLTILFTLFAFFQLNDPDSLSWVVLYGYVAVISGMAIFRRYNLALILPGIAIFAVYFVYLLPSVFEFLTSGENLMNRMDAEKMYIEQTREAGGLLIGLLALIFHLSARSKNSRSKNV